MAGLYSVGTTNRYAMFLGDDEDASDPQDIGKLVQAENAKKTLKSVSAPNNTRTNNQDQKVTEVKPPKKSESIKPVKNEDGEDMETVRNRRNRDEKPANDLKPRTAEAPRVNGPPRRSRQDSDRRDRDETARKDGDSRPRRERRDWNETEEDGRVNRRSQGAAPSKPRPRQDGTPNNRRKREFERKSGSDKTGVKAVDKREGGGAHNWGTHKDDLSVPTNLNSPDAASGDDTDSGENKADMDPDAVGKKDESLEIAEVKELTLDEYKALRAKRLQPKFNLRKAGEGEDLSQWKGLVVMDKKKKEADTDEDEELENLDCPQRVGRQKHVLDIDITFKEARRFGQRPGRGGARPTPRDNRDVRDNRDDNNGKPAGNRKQFNGPRDSDGKTCSRDAAAPSVDDKMAFPSLG